MPNNPTHLRPYPMAVAIDHHHHHPHGFKPWKRRFRLRSFPHPDPNLLDLSTSTIRHRKFHRSLSTPCFSTASDDQQSDYIACVELVGSRRAQGTHALVVEAAIAMASGALPTPASSGLSAAYFLRNRSGECFAVVKPIDQESLALSILDRPGSRLSVCAGETGLREVAAYLLDHGRFSGVPPTALIKISHPVFHAAAANAGSTTGPPPRKIASIQRFVPHDFDAGDLGPSRFSVTSVHRIGILDVRLLNIDRHAGNILVKKNVPNINGGYGNESVAELVPIDHGLCLPELLEDPYFEWLHWPQAAVPFTELEAEYVSALDPFEDAELLRAELPSLRESAIRILILCTIFLKRAAAAGLCLADIGGMMTREFCGLEEGRSVLEALCKRAEDSVVNSSRLSEDSNSEHERDNSGDEQPKDFQFEMDCDDGGLVESCIEEVLDIPLLLRSKGEVKLNCGEQLKVLGPLNEEGEEGYGEEDGDGDYERDNGRNEPKLGSITKSVSLSAADFNYECDSSKCISFKWMNEEEWGFFLERFEQLLPEAFEARKSMWLKQRLGTSCKF